MFSCIAAKKRAHLGPRKLLADGYLLDRPSSLSGGRTTSRPSTGKAFSSMLKPMPSTTSRPSTGNALILFVTFAGRYTNDETWGPVTGSGMAILTFQTAP